MQPFIGELTKEVLETKLKTIEMELKHPNLNFMRNYSFWTESKTGFLEAVQPTIHNVKPLHFDFLAYRVEQSMKYLFSIVPIAQMIGFSLFPDGNITFSHRHELELVLTVLRTFSKTYRDSLDNKGLYFIKIIYEVFLNHLLIVINHLLCYFVSLLKYVLFYI
jgi:hypothetical protein